jgi:hypothetical protein
VDGVGGVSDERGRIGDGDRGEGGEIGPVSHKRQQREILQLQQT